MSLSQSEFSEIAHELECYHGVFATLWHMGRIYLVDDIETACIRFDNLGHEVAFLFNRKWWGEINLYEKIFIICHECLHIMLNHGMRIISAPDKIICNYTLDVVVHNILVKHFKFDRSKISFEKKLCWLDTVFPKQNLPDDESFEFYYNRLKNKVSYMFLSSLSLADDHESLSGQSASDIIGQLNEKLSDEERDSLQGIIEKNFTQDNAENAQAGTGTGGVWVFSTAKRKRKKKWETVIKKWSQKFKQGTNDIEQWARLNRRLVMMNNDIFIPSDMEEEKDDLGKIQVWFFQDTSGSCYHLKDRFFAAALSLPKERFDVRMFCFDTIVKETTLQSGRIYGGGGTSFRIIEDFIQKYKEKDYPKAVFLITDGMGDMVKPEIPNRWYWFLSYNYTSYIPKESNIFKLGDFE